MINVKIHTYIHTSWWLLDVYRLGFKNRPFSNGCEASLLKLLPEVILTTLNAMSEWGSYSQKFNLTFFCNLPDLFLTFMWCRHSLRGLWTWYVMCTTDYMSRFLFLKDSPVFWSDVKYFLPPVTCLFCVEYFSTCVLCRC